MSDSLVLREMIIDSSSQVSQLDSTLAGIESQISSFQEKQDALKNGVCTKAAENLEEYLVGTKFSPSENYNMYKGDNFNQSLSEDGNLIDWKIYRNMFISTSIFLSANEFTLSGDQTLVFTSSKLLSFLMETSQIRSYTSVDSSEYDAENDITTITLIDEVLTENSFSIWEYIYSYIEGDDTTIDTYKEQWDFAYDYINHEFGSNGTYGTKANISQLNSAKTLLEANRTKINDSTTMLEPFI